MTSRALGPIVIKSHASPAPKPRGGRPGKWAAVYKAIDSLKPGEWFAVPNSADMEKPERYALIGCVRKWLRDHDIESVTCYSDLDGAVIVKAEKEPA